MMPHTLLALVLAARAILPGEPAPRDETAARPSAAAGAIMARYETETREVTNWRLQAADALEPKPIALMAALFKIERPVVTRCVKLNNYWCVKSARWDGELATDTEGHVGFVSADQGADAAATLLRRYYLQFNRKSALDIVRRWAPADCGVATSFGGIASLAIKGIGNTLRARYLASHRSVKFTAQPGRGAKPGRVSMVMQATVPQYRVPDIAVGMGEHHRSPPAPPPRVKPVAPVKVATATPKANTATGCAPDEQRLRNYANAMVENLGIGPSDDLELFADDGTPLPNLSPVMLAMSAFELGLLRASPDLVGRAVQRAATKAEANAKGDVAQDQAKTSAH
ncbi:hypothetical protein [Microvirga alba]|uniref:Uncharacterized protein n=1 Tax=Microvirga alba TaxID=2791025 RepID=A0A931BM84_9HYPH|nr:hypothetical protein [Microvirga alba]MBF9233456.1 hypothetical protein [Microvirga alba]